MKTQDQAPQQLIYDEAHWSTRPTTNLEAPHKILEVHVSTDSHGLSHRQMKKTSNYKNNQKKKKVSEETSDRGNRRVFKSICLITDIHI